MTRPRPALHNPNSPYRLKMTVECAECGQKFHPWHSDGKFCTLRCRSTSSSRRQASLRPPTPQTTVSAEQADEIRAEAEAALDNLRKRLDG